MHSLYTVQRDDGYPAHTGVAGIPCDYEACANRIWRRIIARLREALDQRFQVQRTRSC